MIGVHDMGIIEEKYKWSNSPIFRNINFLTFNHLRIFFLILIILQFMLVYEFRRKEHLETAFIRNSYAEEVKIKGENVLSNEVYKFFGDSVSIFRHVGIDGVSKARTQ